MKKVGIAIGVLVALFLVFTVVNATRPRLLAKVSITKNAIVVLNGNDTPWVNAVVRLASEVDAPKWEAPGPWQPGEEKILSLADFRRTVSGTAFKPDFERPSEISITADGFQLGIYK